MTTAPAVAWFVARPAMDSATYDALGLSLPHHDKDPPGGMVNLNTGQPNSWGRAGDPVADNPLDALYCPGPLATSRLAGAPAGVLHHYRGWEAGDTSVYPGTTRDWSVYIPQQATIPEATPAALMVCLDGAGFLDEDGAYHTAIVADNLIHSGKIPATVIVFINPGKRPNYAEQRSLEYDTVSDANVTFISSEVLPLVAERHCVTVTADPALRVAAGGSSGGIGAFCMAWFRPDLFGVAISHIGSFVNIRGGHNIPWLIRNTQRKPIRVFLQDGRHDLNNQHGSWPLAHQEMVAALSYAGYDCASVFGFGGHSRNHGGSIFPQTLEWVFSAPGVAFNPPDDPAAAAAAATVAPKL